MSCICREVLGKDRTFGIVEHRFDDDGTAMLMPCCCDTRQRAVKTV